MSDQPPVGAVPPIEPSPAVAPPVAVPPPPVTDPYAAAAPPPPPNYAPAGYAPPSYQAGYYAAPQPPRGLAIASMVTGIVGAFFSLGYGFGLLPSIAAIITGHLARKRQPYARGMWLTGLICGYVGLGISVLWIIGIIVFIVWAVANSGNFDGSSAVGTNT
jgi:hypothetical protein